MNLKDEEWEPLPTDPTLLRKVRAAANACASTHDLSNLRTALLSPPFNGAIPHEVRGAVWLLLLRLRVEALLAEDAATFAQAARDSVADANAREQIEKDVERTRPGLERFKQPAVRGALLRLLSLFCDRKGVAYVQGFNELLAPFVLLADTGGNPRLVYALFAEFVGRFAPWMLETSETRVFDVLKRLFKYFGRVLLYHDPELYWLLERHMMTPDLYATSWFVTLFARNFTVESVLALWDLLLLEDNPLGTSFFGVALLCSKRDVLLSVDESRIPETLMMLTAHSAEEVRRLWQVGSRMRVAHTPPSFQRLMIDRLLAAPGKPNLVGLSAARAMQASVCLQTTPEDLVAGEAHYFTWDCRTLEEYNSGHLAQAAHLPLDSLREANGKITSQTSDSARRELQNAVDLCEPLKDKSHICLVGSGIREEDNMDINVLALYLTRIGIRYVSTLRGGFREALAAAGNADDSLSGVELVDFDYKKHERARKARVMAQNRKRREREKKNTSTGARADRESKSPRRRKGGNDDDATGQSSSRLSSSDQAATPSGVQGISSFLEKTDAEVSRALNKALSGIGLKYSLSTLTPGQSGERETERAENFQTPSPPAPSYNPYSPNAHPSPAGSVDKYNANISREKKQTLQRTEGIRTKRSSQEEPYLQRSFSSMNSTTGKWAEENVQNLSKRSGASTAENSPRLFDTPSYTMSPRPGVQVDPNVVETESPIRQKVRMSSSGFFSANKSPWGRDAKPGWLGEDTLSFDIATMPKGFTVNVMDDRVMAGLRLFPCKARSDQSAGLRGRENEFKRRYVGVSANYFLLLSPHSTRSHLLEVKLIRYLQDISRITFKRSRPELVTFEILAGDGDHVIPESVVCVMPDGLKECVALIKEYLADVGVGNEAETPVKREREHISGVNLNESQRLVSQEEPDEMGSEAIAGKRKSSANSNQKIAVSRGRDDVADSNRQLDKCSDVPISCETSLTDSQKPERTDPEAEYLEFGEFQEAPTRL